MAENHAARSVIAPYRAARSVIASYQTAATKCGPPGAVVAATVDDLQRAVEEVKLAVRKAKREIIKDAHTARTSEADRRAPKGERGRQIAAVRKLVRAARAEGRRMTILQACRKTWQNIKGGYPSAMALYDYCHAHRGTF